MFVGHFHEPNNYEHMLIIKIRKYFRFVKIKLEFLAPSEKHRLYISFPGGNFQMPAKQLCHIPSFVLSFIPYPCLFFAFVACVAREHQGGDLQMPVILLLDTKTNRRTCFNFTLNKFQFNNNARGMKLL